MTWQITIFPYYYYKVNINILIQLIQIIQALKQEALEKIIYNPMIKDRSKEYYSKYRIDIGKERDKERVRQRQIQRDRERERGKMRGRERQREREREIEKRRKSKQTKKSD